MSSKEREKRIKDILHQVQAHTWRIETLQNERREFIRELERLEKRRPRQQPRPSKD